MGVEQLAILIGEGVAPSAVVVGHSCGASDLDYHLRDARPRRLSRLRPLRPRAAAPDRARVAVVDRPSRRRLRAPDRPVARYRLVLARPRADPAAGGLPDWEPTHVFAADRARGCARPACRRRRSTPCWSRIRAATSRRPAPRAAEPGGRAATSSRRRLHYACRMADAGVGAAPDRVGERDAARRDLTRARPRRAAAR